MELRTSFLTPGSLNELLAVIEVTTEGVEPWEENQVRRRITGTVRNLGEAWERFVRAHATVTQSDGPYLQVDRIQVDHDFYPFRSLIRVDRLPEVQILVVEHFTGSDDEYFAEVRERNAALRAYLDAWKSPGITRNDIRELIGLPRQSDPALDQPLPADEAARIREGHFRLHGPFWNQIV